MTGSRYRSRQPSDYSHRFHAGNVGDVWKHLVLVEVLRASGASTYVESHAGEGEYALEPTGEWTEGIGRLWSAEPAIDDDTTALGRYVALSRALGADRYPGSPLLARAVLGADAELRLFELDPAAGARLTEAIGSSPMTHVSCADGLDALAETVQAAERRGAVVALVDPPFTQKPDWTAVPEHVIAAARASDRATLLLWYPVKSLTRPNAMIARFQAGGISASIAEVITTPLEHQRRRLNGSGLLMVRPPVGVLESVAAAAASVGERCATRDGVWSVRLESW